MSSVTVPSTGGGALPNPYPLLHTMEMDAIALPHRDPDADRGADHYGPGAGGKKRKVPAFPQVMGAEGTVFNQAYDDGDDTLDKYLNSDSLVGRPSPLSDPSSTVNDQRNGAKTVVTRYHRRNPTLQAQSFHKALFLRRKAALITLYLDAQNAILDGTIRLPKDDKNPLPPVPDFEKLIPALEDLGLNGWAADQPG
jgi:hypothetical protein